MASTDVSGSGLLSPDSFSFIHSREVSDSSESYSSLELSEDISSDDEIVWSPSDNDSPSPVFIRSQGAFSPATFSDEDVVVLSRPRSVAERYQSLAAPGSVDALANTLSNLQVTPHKVKAKAKKSASVATSPEQAATSSKSTRRRKRKTTAAATATATATTAPSDPPAGAARKKKAKKVISVSAKPQPVSSTQSDEDDSRSVVDDLSDAGVPSAYDEAVQYVSDMLANPAPAAANSNLKLLHALIIELGLAPKVASQVSSLGMAAEALPRSLRAAKALLKSQVFLNVCDYLANRHKGLDAIRSVMHPSRRALANAIRGGSRMPAKQVKRSGLGVLLITCYR